MMTRAEQNRLVQKQMLSMVIRGDAAAKRRAREERQDYYSEQPRPQVSAVNPPTEKQLATIMRMAKYHPAEQVDYATLTKSRASELIGRWIDEWKNRTGEDDSAPTPPETATSSEPQPDLIHGDGAEPFLGTVLYTTPTRRGVNPVATEEG